jgi:hypothetical protein
LFASAPSLQTSSSSVAYDDILKNVIKASQGG